MRAYLAVTGTLFALLALSQIWEITVAWRRPEAALRPAASAVLFIALAIWAWKLFARRGASSRLRRRGW
jgi:dolichyl-phosphate-mannose--protein O-mannosyl transferase